MERRSGRRRQRNVHNDRGVHLGDTVTIAAAGCRAALRDEGLDDVARLMLLVAISSGYTTMTVAELKAAACGAVLDAGGIKAAINRRQIILR
jgi:hypothetical protein